MLRRISRMAVMPLLLAVLLLAGGTSMPVYASPGDVYVEDVVHGADIDGINRLVESALLHLDGLRLEDHDIVYNALGRTNAALDLLYSSGATGDVFNTAERLLLVQRDLLAEVERATLTGDLGDLSTVAPLRVEVAQARLAFERQRGFGFSVQVPFSGSRLGSSLFGRRLFSPTHSFSSLYRPHTRSLSRLHRSPTRSFSTLRVPGHSLSRFGHSTRSLSTLGHRRLFDNFGRRDPLLRSRLDLYGLYR